jgi:hypothetical protein
VPDAQAFRGIERCMWLMRRRDPERQEEGFFALLPHAGRHLDDLIREFDAESDRGLRCWLLELIGEAKSERAFPLLADQLRSDDESLRTWAIYGLERLGSKAARTLLWEAQAWDIGDTPEERAHFRGEVRAAVARLRGGTPPRARESGPRGTDGSASSPAKSSR